MHQLKSFDGGVSRFHRFEAKCGFDPTFQFAVISFNNIVTVFDLPVFQLISKFTFAFERSNGLSVSWKFEESHGHQLDRPLSNLYAEKTELRNTSVLRIQAKGQRSIEDQSGHCPEIDR
jgi:hypothetical protein